MSSTKEKQISRDFYDNYPYGNEAMAKVYETHKDSFKVREAFKVKGILHEFIQFWGDKTYTFILVNGKVTNFNMGYSNGQILEVWEKLIWLVHYGYFNGRPFSSIENYKEVEIVKTETLILEFHKIKSSRVKGNPLKEVYTQIPGTPYSIGRPVMYNMIDGKNNFFYDKDYRILRYDVEQNLKDGKRFNTRYSVSFKHTGGYVKVLDGLIKDLEQERDKNISGYYNDFGPFVWNEPNPEMVTMLQDRIDKVKLFKETYKGQE